jgi:phosphoglucosamine mutase
MGKLFGTDGIRAVAGEYPLDPSTLFKLGLCLVRLGMKRILIGRDTRASGVWIQRILERAIRAEGGDPDLVGVMTSPGVSFLTRTLPFDAGVVISASHNPYHDNGVKIFSHAGIKICDAREEEIEGLLTANQETYAMPPGVFSGWQEELCDFEEIRVREYVDDLKQAAGGSLQGFRVVIDCANGAAFHIAPRVLKELGAEVVSLNIAPDGHNINHDCGALHPNRMAKAVVDVKAHFGIALDGDSDRAIMSDEEGNLVDGDHMLLILGDYMRRRGRLATTCIVTTVMANIGLEVALREHGLRMVRTKVGDRFVLEAMLQGGHSLGGEQSGHIIVHEHAVTGDGILTGLKIAQVLREEGRKLSELRRTLSKFPQILLNLKVREKRDFSQIATIAEKIEEVEKRLGDRGRVLVRYSGTEPLVRIMVEGERHDEIVSQAEAIAARFRAELGASAVPAAGQPDRPVSCSGRPNVDAETL